MEASLEKFRELRDRLARAPEDDALLYACCEAGKDVALEETINLLAARLRVPPAAPGIRLNELHLLAYLRERAARRARGMSVTSAVGPDDLDFRFARNELAAVIREASTFLARYPDSRGATVILAEALTSFGTLGKAEKVYAGLRACPDGEVTSITNFDPGFHAVLAERADAVLAKLPTVSVVRDLDPTASRIVFLSADYLYFHKFGWAFVDSFVRRGAGEVHLSLHVMDMTPAEAASVRSRLEGYPGLAWGLSTEWTGLRKGSREAARNYYHAVRFVRFWQTLLRHPRAAVFMIDADTIFNGEVAFLFELLGTSDLALMLCPGRFEARNKICATCTGAANTEAARSYLRAVAGYIAAYWETGRLAWGVDQVAMYAVLALSAAPPRIVSIPDRVTDGSRNPAVLLWPAKG